MAENDVIGRRDLFQFIAIILAGGLIFMTVSFTEPIAVFYKAIILSSLIPFIISSIMLMQEQTERVGPLKKMTMAGLAFLALAVGVAVTIPKS